MIQLSPQIDDSILPWIRRWPIDAIKILGLNPLETQNRPYISKVSALLSMAVSGLSAILHVTSRFTLITARSLRVLDDCCPWAYLVKDKCYLVLDFNTSH